MGRIIAVVNMKGGVGKTTTVVHLGHALARRGQNILIVDLDAQANLTLWMGNDAPADLADVLRDPSRIADAIRPSKASGVDILHGSHETAGITAELQSSRTPVTALRRLLRNITGYDHVILDAAPGLDLLALNAIIAADEVIAPVETHAMALAGLTLLQKTIADLIEDELIEKSPPIRVLATKHDARTGLNRDILDYLRNESGVSVFNTAISINCRLGECYVHKKSVFDVDPRARGANDYVNLAEEFANNGAA
jgi:chromosome partitioning protein